MFKYALSPCNRNRHSRVIRRPRHPQRCRQIRHRETGRSCRERESYRQQKASDEEDEQESDQSESEVLEVERDRLVEEEAERKGLVGEDVEPFAENHFEEDEQESSEREWDIEDLERYGNAPQDKWPTLKYQYFLQLRLPDLRNKMVTVVPGIHGVLEVHLSTQYIDTVC